jgi:hypothetical protein
MQQEWAQKSAFRRGSARFIAGTSFLANGFKSIYGQS